VAIVRYSPARVAGVTVGLSLAGATFGALAGAVVFAIRDVAAVGVHALIDLTTYGLGALVGAPLGAVCAPVAGWLLLRDVPLGRAFLVATVGTIVGGAIGWLFRGPFAVAPIVGGAVGCLIGAILLRMSYKARRARAAIKDGAA
jgi:hypothetical protein